MRSAPSFPVVTGAVRIFFFCRSRRLDAALITADRPFHDRAKASYKQISLLAGTEQEISAIFEHQESATKDLCFLVSILQVRAKVVSFSVSFPKSTLHALIAFLVSIPRRASMDR